MKNKEIQSNQKIIEIAQEFKKLGAYPHKCSLNGIFLSNKKQAFKHYTNGTKAKNNRIWYPSDVEVAKAHGLPDDWMLITKLLDPASREKESNNNVIQVANYFEKYKSYPNCDAKLGSFIRTRRQAFKHYTNGTKNSLTWYPSDLEVAKAYGLPDDWILPITYEIKSKNNVIKLAKYFKKHKSYPNRNTKLGNFLYIRRKLYANYIEKKPNWIKTVKLTWHPSDIEVAKAHGLPNDWMKSEDREKQSNNQIIKLAKYFKKHKSYPNRNTKLGNFLSYKIQAFKHSTNGTKSQHKWYPSDLKVAKTHGLPDEWMMKNKIFNYNCREKQSNNQIIKLAKYFKKHKSYPHKWIGSSIGNFLNYKRSAYKNYIDGTKSQYKWYPSDIEVAKSHGLPDDWMQIRNREKQSNNRTIKLAQYFTKNGIYPKQNSLLGRFVSLRKEAFKEYIKGHAKPKLTWYLSDAEIAKAYGLPDDWMLLVDREKESNQRTILLAQEFAKFNTYPSGKTKIGCFLRIKRLAYKDYINGTKKNTSLWYVSDIEVAKANGLPDDWMCFKKPKSSLGERKTNFVLEKLNIKSIQQYRHKLCANKLCLPFDFYFNKDNLHYFIEYNGEQHYRPVFGQKNITKEENFKKTQKNDLIKLNFCKKNNYPLLVIPYWIKDFENLISEFLKTTQFDPTFAQPTIINQ